MGVMSKDSSVISSTQPRPIHLLLVENDPAEAELLLHELRRAGFAVSAKMVEARQDFVREVQAESFDLILTDYSLNGWMGIEAVSIMKALGLDVPQILVTGTLGQENAVECLKLGVTDFVLKGNLARLPLAVGRALEEKALRVEHAQAAAALRQSEERYRALFENATYGIYRTTLGGELLVANPALAAILGYESPAELIGINMLERVYLDQLDRTKLEEQCLRRGWGDVECEWKRKDGIRIWVRLSARKTRDEAEAVDSLEFVAQDITHRRTLERQLQQAQKFEAIGQLAGGIAHDFNNMIGAILGWAELGMEEAVPDSRLHSHCFKIRQQAERAAVLTRQLLAFARRQILEARNIDLNHAVIEVVSLLGNVLGDNIEIRTGLASGLLVIRADLTQVEQVLMNLCVNARDAMPQGGCLLIETKDVEFDEEYCRHQPFASPGRFVMLSVSDTGVGMDQVTLDHVFEPFFTTKEIGKGTGLGLATAYGIVKQHSGFIHVYSEPGHGTIFRIYFPVCVAATADPTISVSEEPARGGQEMILLAEDHEGLREIARETLSQLGYRVVVAADGEEALALFHKNKDELALVVLDVVLPKLSGPEAYSRMQLVRPGLLAVFATGYSSDMAPLKSVQARSLPILHKPYTPKTLARKVREMLDHTERQPSPGPQ